MNSKGREVLIIEDEPKIAGLMIDYLSASGIATHWISDGHQALAVFNKRQPALVLLDILLPGVDGFNICKRIRLESRVPIIMVTAKVEESDRLEGFDLGADDYICKPFSPRELVYRVKAILNRLPPSDIPPLVVTRNALILNDKTLKATYHAIDLDVTPVEFKLLTTLHDQMGRIFSRDELLDHVYPGHRVVNERTIDSHVKNLRKKMKIITPHLEIIQSVYGVGYKMEVAPAEEAK